MRTLALVLVVLALPLTVRAQELRPFCADRPGKVTPPCILDANHIQVETALADAVFVRHSGAHEDIYAFGVTELRYGFTARLEGEAAWTPLIVDRPKGGASTTGSGDATVGLRWSLTDPANQDGPAASLQAFVNAPIATHGLGAGGWAGGARAPITWPLPAGFNLAAAPEIDVVRNAAGGGTHAAYSTAIALGRTFGETSIGAELWGQSDDDPAGRTRQASFDLTLAQPIGKNGQFDAGLNLGLNRATPSAEIYVGLSHRY